MSIINLKNRNNDLLNFQCTIKKDRLKISNFNKNIIKKLENSNIKINNYNFIENILKDDFLINNFNKNINYDKYLIYENNNYKYKNHIYIINDEFPCNFNELILNKHYKIIGKNLKYRYKRKLDKLNIEDIHYIIYYNDKNLIDKYNFLKNIQNYQNLETFLENKIFLLQIGFPEFQFPDNLKNHYNSWDLKSVWNIKLNKNLCFNFVKKNYNHIINLSLNLIYSNTSKTDLIRHLFLYKYGGLYMDLSVKLLDKSFLNLLNNYDFITCNEYDNKKTFLNGILYSKGNYNEISKIFIQEIVSGIINENLNNNLYSVHFNKLPSKKSFFYGPNTFYNIYNKLNLKNNNNFLLLKCFISKKIKNSNLIEFESYIKREKNDINLLQCKYIGYYNDLYKSNINQHYTLNYKNKIYYYSTLEYIDKILIINLKHRTDRKIEMINQIKKLNLSENKFIFIEAIYDKENGAFGCTKSHLKCINYAIDNNLDNICILEDDYEFVENIEKFNFELLKFFINVTNWDALLLYQSNHGPPVNVHTNLKDIYRNFWSQSTAGYILSKNIFYDFKNLCEKILKINKGPIDFYWNNLKDDYKWYYIKNINGNQRKSYSDIEKCIVKYNNN